VGRIIGRANETAPGAALIAQEADAPILSAPVLGITAAIANLFANIAREREGMLGIVVEGVVVRRARPSVGSILRIELQEDGVSCLLVKLKVAAPFWA